MRPGFEKKSNQMTNDEIKNEIQLEIINVNRTIANKKRWTKSKEKINWRAWFFAWSTRNSRKKDKEKK